MSPTPTARLARFFAPLRTRQAILARRLLGVEDPADLALAGLLARELTVELRGDGSLRGAALPTIWRAHELMDLGLGSDAPGVGAALGWVLRQQDAPGAYSEGCDKVRHAHQTCQHRIGGFFSPAPASVRVAPVTLPNGKAFRAEPAARFVISCLALRAVLRAGWVERPGVRRHLDSLALLTAGWTDWAGLFAPDVMVAGLHALAQAGPAYRAAVERAVGLIVAQQQADGTWPNSDLFQLLDTLVATGLPEARLAVRRAAPAVEQRQRPDGSFGATAQQERALIGLRALRWAGEG
ncbi:MAG TPA: hypothetical protein VHR43_12465 [Gemmatimonadales bacterium]|nr:hypothetical protein [Gemmatimonadales bacterium]